MAANRGLAMSATAVFVERHPRRCRITAVAEELPLIDACEELLDHLGYGVESIDVGADTVWDVAATAPDLVILDLESTPPGGSLEELVGGLREHPRLRRIPVLLIGPEARQAVPMERPRRANFRVVDAPLEERTLGGVLEELVRSAIGS